MAKDVIAEIKRMLKGKKMVIGTESSIKNLKKGNAAKVYLTSNCPAGVRADIMRYAKLNDVEVVELPVPNDELGIICKKPFSISVLSVTK
jgi:large subunit ribosomal protein L30e